MLTLHSSLLLAMVPVVAVAAEIPSEAPNDAITAPESDVDELHEWASSAFLGQAPELRGARCRLRVRRQDHSVLRFRQSCIDTPICVGTRTYDHGLGTHAQSEIAVEIPHGAEVFEAAVGVDNNADTGGTHGTVEFVVRVDGAEAYRSPVCRGGGEPVPVRVELPAGSRELMLIALPTDDGAGYDQADWADAAFIMADGTRRWLDDNQIDLLLAEAGLPFSFTYGGRPSGELLAAWERTSSSEERADHVFHTVRWRDPETGLTVTAEVKTFRQTPAAEWVLYFENQGDADTPIIEGIQALDVSLRTGYGKRPTQIHQLRGDSCGELSFLPFSTDLEAGRTYAMAPTGGRPSSISAFPFFNVQYDRGGAIVAVGWSGQWAATFERAANGPTRLAAGMERTHLLLHPGERIRTPRVLVMPWKGDRMAAHIRFRRLLMFSYAPRANGHVLNPPVALQCFDRYSWTRADWATEAGQLDYVKTAARLGCDSAWLDAAWFPGGFPNGVGNWSAKPVEFPNGLRPVGDACHANGLRFVLWFEPERVAPGTQIATEHPEFVFGGRDGGLFRLDLPEAQQWLLELLSSRVREYGIDVYRNDFNIDPLGYWRANDTPDREGMTEIRYVENHYAMWDELLRRHPGLMIDNCASGGRRIDLETISRSVPLWRSDTSCSPGHADWDQAQACGISLYVPLHTACAWDSRAYTVRSSATMGMAFQPEYMAPTFDEALAQRTLAEVRRNAPFWYGDLYPLTAITNTPEHWMAWQMHRPDLNAGIVLAFRRAECPYPIIALSLRALDPETRYTVASCGEDGQETTQTLTGAELSSDMEIRLARGASLVMR
ncbi:MAG TPA: NPCBM/NEW2 domain-containing protein, partial [Armatimonadota bacterium]|nr:NPCBM/NEW2 domain-containing protein [Armatimonadota bacterium]